jgi:predicted RNA-binding protein
MDGRPEAERGKTSWMALVSLGTWNEFLRAGGEVMGFRESRWNTLAKTKRGDDLFFYLSGASRFIAIFSIVSDPFFDESPIWREGAFPCRIKVRRIVEATPEQGVLVGPLRQTLEIFENIKQDKYWSAAVRHSLKKISSRDAATIRRLLQKNIKTDHRSPIMSGKINAQEKQLRSRFEL